MQPAGYAGNNDADGDVDYYAEGAERWWSRHHEEHGAVVSGLRCTRPWQRRAADAIAVLLKGFLIVCAWQTVGASALAAAAAPVSARIDVETYRLANGLRVTLLQDRRLPVVAVNTWYGAGAANDPPGRTGFAHLFEHLMVFSDDQYKVLKSAGATQVSATTEPDYTRYFMTLPSAQVELALAVESERMGFMLAKLNESTLRRERAAARNERRQNIENPPYGLSDEALLQQLFPPGHPYRAGYVGSHRDIESATLEESKDFYRRYYVPSNASLVVAGDIDKARVRALIEQYFARIPAGKEIVPVQATMPLVRKEKRVTVTSAVELPRITLAWLTAPLYSPGEAEARLLALVLGGESGRLRQRLVRERRLALSIDVEYDPRRLASVFSIKAIARPEVSLQTLERAIDEQLAELRRSGPTPAELAQAQKSAQLHVLRGFERLGDIAGPGSSGGIADRLNHYNYYAGKPDYLNHELRRYFDVTPASAQRVALNTLGVQSRAVVLAVPGERVIDDPPPAAEPAQNNSAAAATHVRAPQWSRVATAERSIANLVLPVPERFTLPNGLTVYLVEQKTLPLVEAQLIVRAAGDRNPPELPGLAAFTADALDEGTARRTSAQIADQVAQLGGRFAVRSNTDAVTLSINALDRDADAAFELLADVALRPTLAPEGIEHVRDSRLAQLAQENGDPGAAASRAFTEALFGGGQPYAYGGLFNSPSGDKRHPAEYHEIGTVESLQRIGRGDVVRFWKNYYAPDAAALVVAGNLSAKELRAMAERHFGDWHGKAKRAPAQPKATTPANRLIVADGGVSPQAQLRVGSVIAARDSEDAEALRVMNIVLGAEYGSRINMNLREKHGYTYYARSQVDLRSLQGTFTVFTAVPTRVAAPAVREILGEIERIRNEPVAAVELETSRRTALSSLPDLFETTTATAASIGQLFIYRMANDHYAALPRQISRVSAADIQRVARRYLDSRNVVVVALGDRGHIEQELRALEDL